MGKLSEIQKEMALMKSKMEDKYSKKKPFKLPFKGLAKRADKSMDSVLVQYLTAKRQVEFKLCKIISGNLIVVSNKVHVLNPNKIWKHKKYMWYIVREIDRLPISNEDYDKVKIRRDDTEADVPLIKAVLGAIQKPGFADKKSNWIILAVIAAVAIGAFLFMG